MSQTHPIYYPLSILALVAGTAVTTYALDSATEPVTTPEACVVLDVTPWYDVEPDGDLGNALREFDTPNVTQALFNAGWTSDPNDGREALYSPGCAR